MKGALTCGFVVYNVDVPRWCVNTDRGTDRPTDATGKGAGVKPTRETPERCALCGESLRSQRDKLLFDLVSVHSKAAPACRGGCSRRPAAAGVSREATP